MSSDRSYGGDLLPADADTGTEQERLTGVFDVCAVGVEPALRNELVRTVEVRRVVSRGVGHGRHDYLAT